MDIKEKLKCLPDRIQAGLPDAPGVYIMKDGSGQIIYIGKAISLKKRVQSYFTSSKNTPYKQGLLASQIRDIEFIPTHSEAEALLLEAGLIKKHQPRYNVELKDGKSYPLVKITDEDFPCVSVCRPACPPDPPDFCRAGRSRAGFQSGRPKRKQQAAFFGPYTNAGLLREALKIIRKGLSFRTCKNLPKKSCLDFHLKLCPAPCIGKISKKDYQKTIASLKLILEGRQEELYNSLKESMRRAAVKNDFEEAARLRDQLQSIASLYSAGRVRNYLQEAQQLKEALHLSVIPERIEAFDISHISSAGAVGSLAYFYKGKPDKNHYRRFRIKESKGNNDCQMLAEVSRRRYSRLKEEGSLLPDLILVDGGKGQVGAIKKELDKLGLNIPLAGLAKEKEEIFLPQKKNPVILAADSPALQLLQRLRDEAHRFAQSYHHILRRKHAFEEKT